MSRPRPGSLASRLGPEHRGTVLVVEDEPDIASFMGAFFRASGTEVVHLDPTSAADVVEHAAEGGTACVLLDLNLDNVTGFEILEALAADERVASIPVLIVSADARAATQERAAAMGAVGFVPKPFNVKDLFRAVQDLLDAGDGGGDRGSADGEPSTSLVSADALRDRLAEAVEQGRRAHAPTTFVLLHLAGAAASPVVVGEVARRMAAGLSDAEILGASAADELAVLFGGAGPDQTGAALDAVLGDGQLELDLGPDRLVTVSVRAGLAACPDHASTAEELYMAADSALADAMAGGSPVVTAR